MLLMVTLSPLVGRRHALRRSVLTIAVERTSVRKTSSAYLDTKFRAADQTREFHSVLGPLGQRRNFKTDASFTKIVSKKTCNDYPIKLSFATAKELRLLSTKPSTMKLGQPHEGVYPFASTEFGKGSLIIFSSGSVVNFTGDAIVNAANEQCIGGGGVDGAINLVGGQKLLSARQGLPVIGPGSIRCNTGDAKITIAGDLPSKFVIHAVGPDYHNFESYQEPDALLRNAYKNAMLRAEESGAQSIAFSLISCGVYRSNRDPSAIMEIGAEAIVARSYNGLKEVHMVAFSDQDRLSLEIVAQKIATKLKKEEKR